MPLKGRCITLLNSRLHLFSSCGGLRNELFSLWQHAPSTTAVCDADRHQLLAVLFLLFTYLCLRHKVAPVPALARTSFSKTTRNISGRVEIETVSIHARSSNYLPPRRFAGCCLLLTCSTGCHLLL